MIAEMLHISNSIASYYFLFLLKIYSISFMQNLLMSQS